MKKSIFLITLLLVGTITFAQNKDKKWGIGLGAGVYQNQGLDSYGFFPQLSLNRYLNSSFDAALQTELGLFNGEVGVPIDIANFALNLKYKINNGYIIKENSTIRPYLFAGPSYLFDNKSEGFDVHYGAGTKIAVSPRISIFAEAGYIDGLKLTSPDYGEYKDGHMKATVGIVYNFGHKKDADGDGVADRKDECPDTPAGVTVDEHGCPVDSDGDGVPDYQDECPETAGLIPLKGCPDRDLDGVADKNDKCPDVKGLEKLDGCPDADNDGIADADDQCPDTPANWKVDEHGCPIDSDGDGLYDEEDDCPTKAGPKSNQGCPVTTPEAIENFHPVLFDTDKSRLRANETNKLDELVDALKKHPEYRFEIYGHTDSRASEAYNMKLSIHRAKAVANFFKDHGINADRILEVKGFGETKPVVPNTSPENMQKNRRVELEFKKGN